MANPFAEDISFEDFLKKYGTKPGTVEQGLNKKANKPGKTLDLQKQVLDAEKVLKGFVPPKGKGVRANGY